MIQYQGRTVTNLEEAWRLIRAGELKCQECGERATDLHNHKKKPEDWRAVCAICHAKIESRDCAWTPIGVLAVRYADIVREINAMNNRIRLRERLGWDAIQTDYEMALENLEDRKKELKKDLAKQVREHPFYVDILSRVIGIGEHNATLLIAVMERAWNQGIRGIRDQRKYFGLFPHNVFEKAADNQKYHKTCKWLISEALGMTIQTKKGLFGERYKYYRKMVNENHPKWSKGHQFNETWSRVAREFMKVIYLEWAKWMGENMGKPHPNDMTPAFENWI